MSPFSRYQREKEREIFGLIIKWVTGLGVLIHTHIYIYVYIYVYLLGNVWVKLASYLLN